VKFLLDTSVISELVRAGPHAGVISWLEQCDEDDLFLSVLTIGELEKGIAKLADPRRRARLTTWVRKDLAARFGARLIPVSLEVAARWGALTGQSERGGQPLPVVDRIIAATSLVHGLVVASRNRVDFERCGVECFDPWTAAGT
jgi:predicted nucleic acid-binding protein